MNKREMSVREAAAELNYPGGQNGLYKFLRKHAGFQRTTPPRILVKQGYFTIRASSFQRGPVKQPINVTKVTTAGLTYIAQLMSTHMEKEAS